MNLRRKSNNTELQKQDIAKSEALRASLTNYYSPTQDNDPKFIRAVEEGYQLNQGTASQITQKKNQRRNLLFSKYDYNSPGSFELAYRVPDNLIGNNLKNANIITQKVNIDMMPEQITRKSKKTDNFQPLKSDFK